MPQRTCTICRALITATGKPGRPSNYCSADCRAEAHRTQRRAYSARYWARAGAKRAAEQQADRLQKIIATPFPCRVAGCTTALTYSGSGRYPSICEPHLKEEQAARRKGRVRTPSRRPCSEGDCGAPVNARDLCRKHYRRWERATGRVKPEVWNDRRRNNYHARRARERGTRHGGTAFLSDIIARNGTDCAACHAPVDLALSWPHPMSKSVDHTIPLARGGAHELSNTTLMHLTCNLSKGARLDGDALTIMPA